VRGNGSIPAPSQAEEPDRPPRRPLRRAARLVALLGAIAVGVLLARAAPEDVVLVYDLSGAPGATALEIALRRDGEVVRRAEFPVRAQERQIRHALRLPRGRYGLEWRTAGPEGAHRGERDVEVEEEGTIVLPLGR
jgi:hypothetical protein